jgi:hypothetical protein
LDRCDLDDHRIEKLSAISCYINDTRETVNRLTFNRSCNRIKNIHGCRKVRQ